MYLAPDIASITSYFADLEKPQLIADAVIACGSSFLGIAAAVWLFTREQRSSRRGERHKDMVQAHKALLAYYKQIGQLVDATPTAEAAADALISLIESLRETAVTHVYLASKDHKRLMALPSRVASVATLLSQLPFESLPDQSQEAWERRAVGLLEDLPTAIDRSTATWQELRTGTFLNVRSSLVYCNAAISDAMNPLNVYSRMQRKPGWLRRRLPVRKRRSSTVVTMAATTA